MIDNDINKSRVKTALWWKKFIHNQEKVRLVNYSKLEQSITRKINWFERSVAKSLLQIYLSNPNEFQAFILDVVKNKSEHLKKDDVLVVNNYLKSIGASNEINEFDVRMLVKELSSTLDSPTITYELQEAQNRRITINNDGALMIESCPKPVRTQKLTGLLFSDLLKDCKKCPFFVGTKNEDGKPITCLCKKGKEYEKK